MLLRQAQVNDAQTLRSVVMSLSHYYLADGQQDLPDWFANTLTTSEFERRLNDKAFTHYVYLSNDRIVGYIALKQNKHLYHLFVLQAFHRQGIARKLWEYAIAQGSSDTYSLRSSLYAVTVYQRFGFVISGECEHKDGITFQPMLFDASKQ